MLDEVNWSETSNNFALCNFHTCYFQSLGRINSLISNHTIIKRCTAPRSSSGTKCAATGFYLGMCDLAEIHLLVFHIKSQGTNHDCVYRNFAIASHFLSRVTFHYLSGDISIRVSLRPSQRAKHVQQTKNKYKRDISGTPRWHHGQKLLS